MARRQLINEGIRLKLKLATLALLGLLLVLPIIINASAAQAQSNSMITVTPTTPNEAPFYQSVGLNWTLSFDAVWSYGDNINNPVENATAHIEVKNREGTVLETLKCNTTLGRFAFNYTTSKADILTFTPTSITTQTGQTYNIDTLDSTPSLIGLNATPITVMFDTFKVELLNCDTGTLGKTVTTVKVTYQLLNSTDLPYNRVANSKVLNQLIVTINGVTATETQPNTFTAEGSLINPTAYLNVQVSQEGWTTKVTAFNPVHTANERIWIYAVGAVSALALATVGLRLVFTRKASRDNPSMKPSSWPFIGAILLGGSSAVSFFWLLTGVEGCMHWFDWILFSGFAVVTFVLGLVGTVLAFRKRLQPVAIATAILPMLTNVLFVKAAFDSYMLPYSLLTLLAPAALAIASIIALCSDDEAFKKP